MAWTLEDLFKERTEKWQYLIAIQHTEITTSFFGSIKDSNVKLIVYAGEDKPQEFSIAEGLNYMGHLGYELMAIQQVQTRSVGKEPQVIHIPDLLYIFKRPVK